MAFDRLSVLAIRLDRTPNHGSLSGTTVATAAAGVAIRAAWVAFELRSSHPVVDLTVKMAARSGTKIVVTTGLTTMGAALAWMATSIAHTGYGTLVVASTSGTWRSTIPRCSWWSTAPDRTATARTKPPLGSLASTTRSRK